LVQADGMSVGAIYIASKGLVLNNSIGRVNLKIYDILGRDVI
jgi:hypothetical protein